MEKTIEIPLGAKDSELKGWAYTIPEGYKARIDGNKIILEPKESEDERIRKALIEHFKWNVKQILNDFDNKEVLSWLEKQGSQNLANSEKTCKDEQNPAWSEEDEEMVNNIIEAINYLLVKNESWGFLEDCPDWLKSLKERIKGE